MKTTSFKNIMFVLIAIFAITLTACAAGPTPTQATVAVTPQPSPYNIIVTVNDVRIFSEKTEGETEFLFTLDFSYYHVAVCHGGDRCVEQVKTALDGYWPETLDVLGPFLYRDGRDKVEVTVKTWPGEGGTCMESNSEFTEYTCTPGTVLVHTIEYDASRHSWEEGGTTVVSITQPYLSVTVKP